MRSKTDASNDERESVCLDFSINRRSFFTDNITFMVKMYLRCLKSYIKYGRNMG